MPRKKKDDKKKYDIPYLYVPENATLEEIYAIAKKEFTAADLAKYAEIDEEPGVPIGQLLTELEAIHEKETRKRNRKRKKS
jgi:hypothetical protein